MDYAERLKPIIEALELLEKEPLGWWHGGQVSNAKGLLESSLCIFEIEGLPKVVAAPPDPPPAPPPPAPLPEPEPVPEPTEEVLEEPEPAQVAARAPAPLMEATIVYDEEVPSEW